MAEQENDNAAAGSVRYCGVVRPIADFDPYPSGHWKEVHSIIADAAREAGYLPRLVSDSESAGVIQGNIVTNLYDDEIVVCDVSGRNPNVMFELGMRVAFEKPVIIIKDDVTPFSFDVAPVKHLTYPSSLRFSGMMSLKADICDTIAGTMEAVKNPNYRGYLQQFGNIKATEIGDQTVSLSQMAEEMRELQRSVHGMHSSLSTIAYEAAIRATEPKFRNVSAAIEAARLASDAGASSEIRYDPQVLSRARRRVALSEDGLPDDATRQRARYRTGSQS
jgi:hypothetical protein